MITTLAALVATGGAIMFFALLIPRIPIVLAWGKRRTEKRILARSPRRSVRTPRRFRTGLIPTHERCFLLLGEAEVFRMITDAEWEPDPKSFRWVTSALKASQKARRP